ncbi:hypothetical protein [Nocardioides humilatus]|uniref:hypothetical protein n=1 Tax=Nocardioides humilatus TaxID=2607660 RepID=UPI00165F3B17|nr:hypothetical protein [Nocardioides humilatus]
MRSTLLVRAVLSLAAAFLLGGTLLAAPATSVAPERAATTASRAPGCIPHCWVAISFNPETLRSGWTQNGNWGTQAGASSSAFNHCKNRPVNKGHARACVRPSERKVYNQNGCVAVAWRIRNEQLAEWAKGKGDGPKAASRAAKREVDGRGTINVGYACAPRRF